MLMFSFKYSKKCIGYIMQIQQCILYAVKTKFEVKNG